MNFIINFIHVIQFHVMSESMSTEGGLWHMYSIPSSHMVDMFMQCCLPKKKFILAYIFKFCEGFRSFYMYPEGTLYSSISLLKKERDGVLHNARYLTPTNRIPL
jgi:hypothetical protein